ncbi:MBL fold metallo-hydrolase [Phototrophicus methaneseepsis]|uniref:MBL fold metallo-hydrolase n=1 Tax=Phototrophicus methaneseepsis TaxID=2710758 RepID=A0A7S8E8G0_9CHLR|nr:MBL fold metallo-hydrolase [Phototrophicus methaneseepsis]QPC82296.1 MBL fold metallo-hydrolase [Phototrophicus methaneseepsis]
MSAKCFSFEVGDFDCTVLLDGASLMGRERILKRFKDATEVEYRQAYADIGQKLEDADTSFNVLVIHTGQETILVDTGEGGKPYGGYLLESMQLAGIPPEAITLVILTHSDGDHVQGLLTDDQKPMFPNARYVISKVEMAFWYSRLEETAVDQRPIIAMMEQKGLRLIDMDEQIVPGIVAVPLPGHKPGQIGLLITSANEMLLHLADVLHSPMQFAHPEWSASFDRDTRVSVPVRQQMLARAADNKLLTLFYHLTFPGLGYIKRAEKGFLWSPLEA